MDLRERPNKLVLIVEDEPRDAELIRELLREGDFRIAVEFASNAEEGLAKIIDGHFDLIICDYCLPGMNGLLFLKVVKKAKGNIPILVLTGRADQELEAQVIRHGACTYLNKNGDPSILLNVVREALGPVPDWVV